MRRGIEALAEVVAPSVLLGAINTSRRLTELDIPHALIGGLAVGLHGHPRATKDVDFLVGDQAFERMTPILVYREELSEITRIGVVDLMGVPPRHGELRNVLALPTAGEIPVIPAPALILLKLLAARPQDLEAQRREARCRSIEERPRRAPRRRRDDRRDRRHIIGHGPLQRRLHPLQQIARLIVGRSHE